MFIGYTENSTIYMYLVIKSENNLWEVIIMEIKNIDFFETIFPMKNDKEMHIQRAIKDESNDYFEI